MEVFFFFFTDGNDAAEGKDPDDEEDDTDDDEAVKSDEFDSAAHFRILSCLVAVERVWRRDVLDKEMKMSLMENRKK